MVYHCSTGVVKTWMVRHWLMRMSTQKLLILMVLMLTFWQKFVEQLGDSFETITKIQTTVTSKTVWECLGSLTTTFFCDGCIKCVTCMFTIARFPSETLPMDEEKVKCLASGRCAWENAKIFTIFCLFPSFLLPPFAVNFFHFLRKSTWQTRSAWHSDS